MSKTGIPEGYTPIGGTPMAKRVLVKRAGMFHLVDPATDCATITFGKKDEAKAVLGKLRLSSYPRPIHTFFGTLVG